MLKRILLALLFSTLPLPAFAAATITIVNVNAPGVGFNDPTPAVPVGGNPGTTLGQQRLIAFQLAADIWGAALDGSVPVKVQASFVPLACTAGSAVLGSAGALQIFANSPGTDLRDTWYSAALANRLAGDDLDPNINEIQARFNSNLGQPGCLGGVFFYLGLDNNHGTDIDLVTVLLHEFAHGLGFQSFTSVSTGSRIAGRGDIYSEFTRDLTTGKNWNDMTSSEIVASAIRARSVIWDGRAVTAAVPSVLTPGTPLLRVSSPAAIAADYSVGLAAFGPPLTTAGVTGDVVAALDPADAAGSSTFDACSPLTNGAAVAGNIALVNRGGTCSFVVKAKNCQNAGATAVLMEDNVASSPPAAIGGSDPTITIPSVRITQMDGETIRNALASDTVNATLIIDPAIFAGADPDGGALLYSPNPVLPGSSISHWDTLAKPNLLMEPAINANLTHGVDVPADLTVQQMTDIGWFSDFDGVADGRDRCLNSDQTGTVVIQSCDSGVPDVNSVFRTGCRISDDVKACAASSSNHDKFVECTTSLTDQLKKLRVINGRQRRMIQACADQSSLP